MEVIELNFRLNGDIAVVSLTDPPRQSGNSHEVMVIDMAA